MAPQLYQYLEADTLYDVCAVEALAAQITDHPWITGQLISVVLDPPDGIDITFAAALSVLEKGRLDGIVAGHDGVKVARLASRGVVGLEFALAVGAVLAVIDGFAIDPRELAGVVSRLTVRLSGEWKTTGAGAELQVSESTDAGDEYKFAANIALPDTAGIWDSFTVDSDVDLREGDPPNFYRLLGKQGAATAASIRFCELALIWV